jgi:hypothetical protein
MLPFVSPKSDNPSDAVDIKSQEKTFTEKVGAVLKKTAVAGVVGSLGSSDLSFNGAKSKKIGADGKLSDQTNDSSEVSMLMSPLNDIREILRSMGKSVQSILESIR